MAWNIYNTLSYTCFHGWHWYPHFLSSWPYSVVNSFQNPSIFLEYWLKSDFFVSNCFVLRLSFFTPSTIWSQRSLSSMFPKLQDLMSFLKSQTKFSDSPAAWWLLWNTLDLNVSSSFFSYAEFFKLLQYCVKIFSFFFFFFQKGLKISKPSDPTQDRNAADRNSWYSSLSSVTIS